MQRTISLLSLRVSFLFLFFASFGVRDVSLQPQFPDSLALNMVIASRPFRLRSKCSICSRRFESRRWSHWGQALSSGFLDIGQDHPGSLGPVPRIVSTLQCRRVRSTPVSFGKREPYSYKTKWNSFTTVWQSFFFREFDLFSEIY